MLKEANGTEVAFALGEADVREFFAVDRVEMEPDGSILVSGPVQPYYLSREEIRCCLRHLSARRGIGMCHFIPRTRLIGRP